jgi:FkbM family methyltransferase
VLDKFEKDIVSVLYDADPDCLPQVQERNQRLESELHVLPYCLGDVCGPASFHITADPFASSLRVLNRDYASYYTFYQDQDYIFTDALRAMERRPVETVTMDKLLGGPAISAAPPDFLSCDTQGTEYEILQGAKETLKSRVLGLIVEVEFHPIYKDQKLFGDITQFLSGEGFDFVTFLSIDRGMSPFRAPVGLRAQGFQTYADALYLKRLDKITNDTTEIYLMLQKLAFISIVLNQFEYGLQCLNRSAGLIPEDSIQEKLKNLSYYRFLRTLQQQIARTPVVFPPTFASKFTFEASKARFLSEASRARFLSSTNNYSANMGRPIAYVIKKLLRKFPTLYSVLRSINGRIVKTTKSASYVRRSLLPRHSPVETVLISYGLKTQAGILRKNRLVQEPFCEKPEVDPIIRTAMRPK